MNIKKVDLLELTASVKCEILSWLNPFDKMALATATSYDMDESDDELKIKTSQCINYGSVSLMKFAEEMGCTWDDLSCDYAAKNGHFEVLRYFHKNGYSLDNHEWTISRAALNGHLEVVRYLHENGCSWGDLTIANATSGGHLAVLRYLHENGCRWDEWYCEVAATKGHLNILCYLKDNGCPLNRKKCIGFARLHNHNHVIEYLLSL